MGLDNGIRIKGMSEKDYNKMPYKESIQFYTESNCIEPVYWRKCWGLREVILDVLHMKNDEYKKEIDPEDISTIIRKLKPFLSRDYWDEYADSIWEYDEYFDTIYQQLVFLEWFKVYYKKHPKLEVYFYDSY